MAGQEDLLVGELGERQSPARTVHGEAGAEPGTELEESAPGIKLVAGVTPPQPPHTLLGGGGRALTQQGSPGAPGGRAGDTWHRAG